MSPKMALFALSTPLALAACKPSDEPPVCPAFVGSARADEADTRVLPAAAWFQLLVPKVSRPELLPPDDPRECSGKQVAVSWPDDQAAARDPRARAEPLPRRPLTEADLTFGEGPEGTLLVWARIAFYADGTASGPVALARWAERGLEVRGIGTLWAPHRRARLRLEPLGEDAQVLVADAELCPAAKDPPAGDKPDRPRAEPPRRCRREIYLLPLIHQRFVQTDLLEDGAPTGPARIASFEQSDARQKDGWIRHSEVRRVLRFGGPRVTIAEAIRIRDCDPKSDMSDCEEHELMRYDRPLVWKDGRFSTTRSAWGDVVAR